MKKINKLTAIALVFVVATLTGCSLTQKSTNTNTNTNEDLNSTISMDESIEVVTTDVFGEELDGVPRYTGSIRSYFSKDASETSVIYQTKDEESKVRDFYKTTLEAKGWTQVGVATDYIDFEKGNVDNPETLTIYFTYYENEKILEYELDYLPPLTEEELNSEIELDEETSVE